MDRLGFGRQAVFEMVKDRSRGIIHVRENCYGWHGPWSHRSGWQQISDAVSTPDSFSLPRISNVVSVLWCLKVLRQGNGTG